MSKSVNNSLTPPRFTAILRESAAEQKKPQTLVVQRIEGRKNLQHFCNKRPRNYPKIPQNTASREALFFQKKAKKKPRNHCDSKVFSCRVLTEKMQEQSLVSQGFAGF